MKKRLLFLVLGLLCLGLIAGPASAAVCSGYGQISYSMATPTGTTYVIGGFPFLNYYYSVTTANAILISKMDAAMARGGHMVQTKSNLATACPTTGNLRNFGTLASVEFDLLY